MVSYDIIIIFFQAFNKKWRNVTELKRNDEPLKTMMTLLVAQDYRNSDYEIRTNIFRRIQKPIEIQFLASNILSILFINVNSVIITASFCAYRKWVPPTQFCVRKFIF